MSKHENTKKIILVDQVNYPPAKAGGLQVSTNKT